MIEKTARCLEAGVGNLCEASFRYEGLYCAVDILRKQGGGYAIYEVKRHPTRRKFTAWISRTRNMYSTAPLPRRMWPVSSSHNSLENPPLPCQDAGRQRGIIAHFCCRTPINVSGSFLCGGIFIPWGCSQIPDLTGQSSTPFRFLPTCRLETERTGKPALRHTRRG